jgi:SAM-dependent methyltransferase
VSRKETPDAEGPPIDVGALVHDLKEVPQPASVPGLAPREQRSGVPDAVAPTLGDAIVSRRRVIGPLLTGVRRFFLKLVPVENVARQAAQAGLTAEAAAREQTERDLREVSQRLNGLIAIAEPLSGLEAALDQLEIAQRVLAAEQRLLSGQLNSRLEALQAELERSRGGGEPSTPTASSPAEPDATGLDYYAFEKRFRPEETVRERQQTYVEILRDRDPVVDLGCGRGELVELLGGEGTRAYGVDLNPQFVAAAAERGLDVRHEDALQHLAGLETGSLGGVAASHVVEHLDAGSVVRLVRLAFDRLNAGGVLILETPNPESLIAGAVNFHRDLTHVRPIHPDTLEFVCAAAGFADVEVRRLSATPDDELLPRVPPDGPLEDAVNAISDTLNARLYGFQDYAVIARK